MGLLIASREMSELKSELRSAGVFAHRSGATAAKFALLVAAVGALTAAIVYLPAWCAFLLIPIAAIPAASAAMIGHEAAHGSFSSSKRKNDLMVHVAFPLWSGLGVVHWKKKHNVLHHGHPNVHAVDEDIDLWPMALSSTAHHESNALRRFFQRYLQGYFFWPLTLLLGWVMRFESIKALVSRVRQRGIDRAWLADASCIAAHYTLWVVVPSLFFGVLPAVLFYVALWCGVGVVLALIFAPAHIGLPVVDEQKKGWLHQLQTTRNLVLPRGLSFFFVGLEYQVEHHLFPKIPHQNLPKAREIVKSWCERVGAPYQEEPYGAALVDTTGFFFRAWQTEPIQFSDSSA